MNFNILQWRSLKTRVTLFTLAIFLISIWSLTFYTSRMLRTDMQRLLSDQQFSTVSILATEINQELADRLNVLEKIAGRVSRSMMGNTTALQTFLEEQLILQEPFNGGVFVTGIDGTAIAGIPLSAQRAGINYLDRDYLIGALKAGKTTIGRPVISRALQTPVFAMATPIRDAQGMVIGALAGVTDLSKPNFLDRITHSRYGQSGGYLLVAPQHRLVVTASDPSRIMEILPDSGVNPGIDRFIEGYEGSAIVTNPQGVEVLASDKGVPAAGWIAVAALPTAEAFTPIRAMQQRILLITILLTVLAGSLTWRMLLEQLAPLLTAAKLLAARSDDQPPQPLPISRQDEIGELIGAFNRLLDILAQREKTLKDSEAFHNIILNSVAAEIAVVDRNGVIQAVNDRWRRFAWENGIEMGQPAPHAQVGDNYLAICGADCASTDVLAACDGIRAVLDGRLPRFSLDYPCHSPQQQRWFTMIVLPLGSDYSNGVTITHTDITALKHAEQYEQFRSHALELLAGDQPLPSILEAIVRGLEQLYPDVRCSILLLDREGKHFSQSVAPSLPDFYNTAIEGIAIGPGHGSCGTAAFTGERVIVTDIATHPYWMPFRELAAKAGLGACWSQPILAASGRVLGAFAIYHREPHTPTVSDILIIEQAARLAGIALEHKQMEDQVRQLAFYDMLTQLPNRYLLNDRLGQTIAASKRSGCYSALMFLDLDNFKPLNDTHGHVVGDLLLNEAAGRLKNCVREMDTIARFGGDEFVVILNELNADKAKATALAEVVAEKIRGALSELYQLTIRRQGKADAIIEHRCTASIGVVVFVNHESSQDDILKWADMSMYQAKNAGRNAIRFYGVD